MNNKTRNLYIDVMKGLLITLVVIGHLPFFEYDSRTLVLIYSFHMHAFLIIGGILSHIDENTKLSSIIIKRIKGTLIPYFVFYIISLIFIPSPSMEQKMKAVIVMFRGIGDPVNAINLPLWFLTFYFVAMTTFEVIECLSYKMKLLIFDKNENGENEKYGFIAILTLLIIALIMYKSYLYARYYKLPRIPFNVEIAGFCLGFVFLGKILGKYVPAAITEIKKNTATTVFSTIIVIALLFVFITSWYILSMYNGRIDLNARDYKNAFLMYVDAVLGFFIFAILSFPLSKIPLISNLFGIFGENSLYILAYHVPSVFVTNVFIIPYLPPIVGVTLAHNSIISILILTSLGIVFSLILAFIHKSIHFSA
jgi:fucose 4-O-acetylase-like acetyltransferase